MAVLRDQNLIQLFGRIDARVVPDVVRAARAAIERRGFSDLTIDLTQITSAFTDGIVPLVAAIDHLRSRGVEVEVRPPDDLRLKRLFSNANWLHLLDPETPASTGAGRVHLPARRFRAADEQKGVVDAFIEALMRSFRLPRGVLGGIEWAVNEITDNVLNHAASPNGGVVGMTSHTAKREVVFCVADAGRGIRDTLREGHANIHDDREALEEAVKAGVTRNPRLGQGNGLAGTRTITSNSGGEMMLVSGQAQLVVSAAGSAVEDFSDTRQFPGTFVVARIRTDSTVPLDQLLSLPNRSGSALDVIDMRYEDPHEDAFVVRLIDEPNGFGSRTAGRALGTKCRNLLDANPRYPVYIDWTGVTVVSSSFADEFLGKLFVDMGATAYSVRVRHKSMSALVQALVDKAIMQRTAQSMGLDGTKTNLDS